MMNQSHIVTRGGDEGETSLGGGVRVAKDQMRIQVCGDIDELSSVLGLVRAEALTLQQVYFAQQERIVLRIQQELIEFGAEVADPNGKQRIGQSHIDQFETEISEMEAALPPLTRFIIPGADKTSAFLHLARTVCRRAERDFVTLIRTEEEQTTPQMLAEKHLLATLQNVPLIIPKKISQTLLIYLNRLSDLLFVMARQTELSFERRSDHKVL